MEIIEVACSTDKRFCDEVRSILIGDQDKIADVIRISTASEHRNDRHERNETERNEQQKLKQDS